jgi:hypothetical protein
MKIRNLILITATMALTGCGATGQKMLCSGTGTCQTNGVYAGQSASGAFTPRTVQLGTTNYLVVPNYSTGQISSVLPVSK